MKSDAKFIKWSQGGGGNQRAQEKLTNFGKRNAKMNSNFVVCPYVNGIF